MFTTEATRPTWAEIQLDNLVFNFRSAKAFIGEDIEYMAVVKADGYGHGAVRCALALEQAGIDRFGVALPEEGLELRRNAVTKPILCLGSLWPGQERMILENDLTPVIYDLQIAELLDRAAREQGVIADIHIKIDTGMSRIGVRLDRVEEFARQFKRFGNLKVEGIMTHFAAADDLAENEFTNRQIADFENAVRIFAKYGFDPKYKDLANSPGAVAHKHSRSNLVRLGGILYGLGGDVLPKEIEKPRLKPVMSLHTRINYLKDVPAGESLGYGRTFTTKRRSRIATVPIGYQDGYVRALSNLGKVLVRGHFARIVGRISMDWTIIDVTDIPDVDIADEVILIGTQGGLSITAEDLAAHIGTISYEVTCGINRRVIRKYVGSEEIEVV